MLQRWRSLPAPNAGAHVPLPAVPRPSARQECSASAKGCRRAVKTAEGLGLQHAGIPATHKHPSSAPGTTPPCPGPGLNHWKYQNNDEVTFPEQGARARYRCMEKLAKKGLNVQAGCSGRQAPGASVSFKNSLRLLSFFFFPLQGAGN